MPTVAELNIEVNLKDTGTQAEILRLQRMLQQLATEDPDISVRVSAAAAKREFDDLQERITLLDAQSVFIETDADAAVALAQLEELQRAMRNLDRSTVNVDVDIDTQGALAHIAALKVALESIRKQKIDVDPDRKNVKTLNQISAAAQRASGTIRGLATAIIALGPALVPLSAGLLTALLGITAGFAAAGAGATLFGAVTIAAFQPITDIIKKMNTAQDQYNQAVTDKQKETALLKLKALYESLDAPQQAVVSGFFRLRDAWNAFVEKFRPEIFTMAGEAMNAFASFLPQLEPLMANATRAIHQLQTESIAAFKNPVWQEFFQNLTNSAEPAILSFGRSLGNLITGFAGVLNAFFPFSDGILGGLEDLTAKFAEWGTGLADNPGFKKFIAYMQENTPIVIGFLKALGKAFTDLMLAAAPAGEQILKMLTKVFQGFSKLNDINPLIGTIILAFLAFGAVFVNMIGPILAIANIVKLLIPLFSFLGTAIGFVLSPVLSLIATWGLLIAGIGLVVGALILAYKNFDTFREKVDALWQKLVDVGNAIVDAVKPALQEVVSFFKDEWQKFISWWNEHSETFKKAWENIKSAVDSSLGFITGKITASLGVIKGIWNAIWPGLSGVVSGVWTTIKGIISGAFQIIRGIFTVFASIIAGDWSGIWDGLGDIVFGAISIVWGILQGGFQIIVGLLQTLWGAVTAVWDLIVNAFKNGAENAKNFLVSTFNGIVSLLKGAWDGIASGAENFVNTIVGFFKWLWDVLVGNSIIPDMINGIIEWWNKLVDFVSGIVKGFVQFIVDRFGDLLNLVMPIITRLVTIVQTGFNTIKSKVSEAIDAVKSKVSTVMNAIKSLWDSAWNAVETILKNVWNAIKSAVSTAIDTVKTKISSTLDTVKSLWNSAWKAVGDKLTEIGRSIITTVTGIGKDIINAFKNLPGELLKIGASMMNSLAEGIKNAGGAVVGAVGSVIKKAGGALPGSPAEWGPLSGQGYVKLRGQRFMEDLTSSLKKTSGLEMTMRDIADLMVLDANPTVAYDAITSSRLGAFPQASGGSSQTVNVHEGAIVLQLSAGADPEAARRAFDGAADTLGEALLTAIQKR